MVAKDNSFHRESKLLLLPRYHFPGNYARPKLARMGRLLYRGQDGSITPWTVVVLFNLLMVEDQHSANDIEAVSRL